MKNKKHALLGKKILLIGTDNNFLNMIERMFLYAGIDIVINDTIEQGIATIKSYKPDLVLIESSEDKNGSNSDIVKNIRDNNEDDLPIILVTDDEDQNKYDVDYVVPKLGIDLMDLIKTIENIFLVSKADAAEDLFDISEISVAPTDQYAGDKKIKVMVVEDDPLLRSLLSVRLAKSKIPYQFCHNGNDAKDMAIKYEPTIIILDIMLPGKNGLDVLKELRALPKFAQTPVVVFSNKDNGEDKNLAYSLGVKHFLVKAMTDLNDLVRIILESD